MSTKTKLSPESGELLLKSIWRRTRVLPTEPGYIGWDSKTNSTKNLKIWTSLVVGKIGNERFFMLYHFFLKGYVLEVIETNQKDNNGVLLKIESGNIPFKRVFSGEYRYLRKLDRYLSKLEAPKAKAEEAEKKKEAKIKEAEIKKKEQSFQEEVVRSVVNDEINL